MTITFKTKESFATILVAFMIGDKSRNFKYQPRPQEDKFNQNFNRHSWVDTNHWASMNFSVSLDKTQIICTTCWSNFQYIFNKTADGGCEVIYTGAFAGFLEQDMMPQITAILKFNHPVVDSKGVETTLYKYAKNKAEFPRVYAELLAKEQARAAANKQAREEQALQKSILRGVRK